MLIGNIFPLILVTREIHVVPVDLSELREAAAEAASSGTLQSYWSHADIVSAASQVVGVDLRPTIECPILRLDAEGLPTLLDGEKGETIVYVLLHKYRLGFRPVIGQEIQPSDIRGWQALKISFI